MLQLFYFQHRDHLKTQQGEEGAGRAPPTSPCGFGGGSRTSLRKGETQVSQPPGQCMRGPWGAAEGLLQMLMRGEWGCRATGRTAHWGQLHLWEWSPALGWSLGASGTAAEVGLFLGFCERAPWVEIRGDSGLPVAGLFCGHRAWERDPAWEVQGCQASTTLLLPHRIQTWVGRVESRASDQQPGGW